MRLVGGTALALSDADKANIVAAHDDARANVDPPAATPLGTLTWDDTLAANSADYAAKCIWGHSKATGNSYPGTYGENLYMSTGTTDIPSAVAAWVAEKQYYDYNTNSCAAGQVCGHYTQVVWSGVNTVGCGYADCDSIDDRVNIPPQVTSGRIVVCQYDSIQTGAKPY